MLIFLPALASELIDNTEHQYEIKSASIIKRVIKRFKVHLF